MRKIDKYKISDVYTLVALQDTERGYLDFRVERSDVDRPEIMVISDLEDYSMYNVKVLTTSVGALDSLDLEFYITELEEAWEAVDDIIETIMINYDVRAM